MDGINNVTQLADRLTPFLIPRILRAIPAIGVVVGGNGGSDPGGGGGEPGTEYTGGQGIDITGTVISADLGQGLGFDGSDKIRVRLATPSGLDFNVSGELVLSDGVAGFGLNISGKELFVNQATSYTWTGSHVFQTDTNIAADLIFQGANRKLRTLSNNNLWLQPHGTGRIMLNEFGTDIRTEGAISNFLGKGWQLNNDSVGWSHLDIRSIYAEELHVTAFIADYARVQVGETFLSNSSALLADVGDGFTVPAVSSSAKIYIEDVPDFVGQVFGNNDYVMIRFIERSAGLIVGTVWGQVTAYSDEPTIDDVQSYTFTTRSASAFLVGKTAKMGSLVIGFGQSGDAYIHQSVIANDGPWERYVSWVTNPYTPANRTLHMQLGNLSGVTDSELNPAGYGIYSDNAYLKGKVQTANTMLDNSGVTMNTTSRSDWNLVDGFKFERSLDDEYYGGLFGYWQSGAAHRHVLGLRTTELAGRNEIVVNARSVGTGDAEIIIESSSTAFPAPDFQTRIQLLNGDTIKSRIRLNAKQIDLFGTGDSADRIATIALRPNLDATYDLGTATHQWKTLYVDEIIAGTITGGEALGGQIWQYDDGDMFIRSTSATLRTLHITNPGLGSMNLDLEGSITLGGSVDGVSVSGFFSTFNTHVANANAHHAAATGGDGINVTGQSVAVNSSVVRTSRTLTAGDGLSGGGTLAADRSFAVDSTVVRTSRTLTAGTGLSGGGTLAADRTFNVNQAFSFAWTAQHAFNPGSSIPPFTLNGNAQGQTVTGFRADQLNKSVLAGDGLTGGGLMTANRTLTLGTPSQISAVSSNTVTSSSHNHSVLASNNPVNERILKSTTAGGLTLQSLNVVGAVDVGQSLFAGNSSLRAIFHTHDYDHMHLVINPGPFWNLDEQFGVDIDDNLLVRGWIVGKHAIQVEGAVMLAHFDGPQPYNINFVGNATGHMGQVPTYAGTPAFYEGKFQTKCIGVTKAGTNLTRNSYFEDDDLFWTPGTSAATTVTTRPFIGQKSAYYSGAANGVVLRQGGYVVSVANGQRVWLNCWVYCSSTNMAQLRLFDIPTPVIGPSNKRSNGWEMISVEWHNTTGSSHSFRWEVQTTQNGHLWIDAFTCSVNSDPPVFAAPFMPNGTADGPNTTVAASDVRYEAGIVPQISGTVALWFRAPWGDYHNQAGLCALFSLASSGTNFRIVKQSFNASWSCHVGGAGQTFRLDTNNAQDTDWHYIVLTYDVTANASYVYLDGNLISSGGASAFTDGILYVGSDAGGSRLNGYIEDLSIFDRVLSADEIRTIYESNAPIFAETSTWHWRAGRNRVYADAEGLWAIGANQGAILGLYAGDDNNPSATKSWGGLSLSEGDLLIGNSSSSYMFVDRSAETVELVLSDGANQFFKANSDGVSISVGAAFSQNKSYKFELSGSSFAGMLASNTGSAQTVAVEAGTFFGAGNINSSASFGAQANSDRRVVTNLFAIRGTLNTGFELWNESSDRYIDVHGPLQLVDQSTPNQPASGRMRMYFRSPNLVIVYRDGSTNRYKYLNLSGTGVTWQHSTSPP